MVQSITRDTGPNDRTFPHYKILQQYMACKRDMTCYSRPVASGPLATFCSSSRCLSWYFCRGTVRAIVKTDFGTTMPMLRVTKPIRLASTNITTCFHWAATIPTISTTISPPSCRHGASSPTAFHWMCCGESKREQALRISGTSYSCHAFTSSNGGCPSSAWKSRKVSN